MNKRIKIIIGLLSVLLFTAAAAMFVVIKTDLFLADIRPAKLGGEKQAAVLLNKMRAAHDPTGAWNRIKKVRMSWKGFVPSTPARFGFGVPHEQVRLTMEFSPREKGPYKVDLKSGKLTISGEVDTRRDRDGLGLLYDSVRHLFELPIEGKRTEFMRAMSGAHWNDRAHERLFLSWGKGIATGEYDQLILWLQAGRLTRFDTTGRDIAPFIVARVEYRSYTVFEEMILPGKVVILDTKGAVVHEWELIRAEKLPRGR